MYKPIKTFIVIIVSSFLFQGCNGLSLQVLNEMEITEFSVKDDILFMENEINSQTLKQFEDIYAKNPQIKTLVQLYVPGSIDDDTMIKLSYRVRELGLNTHLTARSEIYSGGVDLFLAGVKRTMEEGAIIGVHSWADNTKEARDYPRHSPEHDIYIKYVKDMIGDDSFYWFTIYAAPAQDMYIMKPEEIKKYGLLNG